MKTRILLYCFICCTAAFIASAQEQTGYQSDSGLLVMFWNLENFFSPSSEGEFSSTGSRHWTRKRFQAKGRAVAKTVFWTKDIKGRFPDVIGFAETENRTVLERLLSGTVLRKVGYSIVHYDSQDPRGIDVSLLYRKSSLVLLDSAPLRIAGIRTRDILMAKFRKSDGDSIVFLVNHHPSKYGPDSGWKRAEALKRLREAVDSLMDKGLADVVAMGDFNDTPENPAFRTVASPSRRIRSASCEPCVPSCPQWCRDDQVFGKMGHDRHVHGVAEHLRKRRGFLHGNPGSSVPYRPGQCPRRGKTVQDIFGAEIPWRGERPSSDTLVGPMSRELLSIQ